MTSVLGSFSQKRMRSLPDTSALFPTLMNCDMPMPWARAYSRMASPSGPDWLDMAMFPAGGMVGAKVPSIRTGGAVLRIPMEFGPTRRMLARRAISTSSSSARRPSSPVSAKPAEMTTSPRTPFSAHCSAISRTWGPGTTTMARSTGSGMSRRESYALTELTTAAFGFTGYTAPANPWWRRFRKIVLPIAPGRDDAPMTATDRG